MTAVQPRYFMCTCTNPDCQLPCAVPVTSDRFYCIRCSSPLALSVEPVSAVNARKILREALGKRCAESLPSTMVDFAKELLVDSYLKSAQYQCSHCYIRWFATPESEPNCRSCNLPGKELLCSMWSASGCFACFDCKKFFVHDSTLDQFTRCKSCRANIYPLALLTSRLARDWQRVASVVNYVVQPQDAPGFQHGGATEFLSATAAQFNDAKFEEIDAHTLMGGQEEADSSSRLLAAMRFNRLYNTHAE